MLESEYLVSSNKHIKSSFKDLAFELFNMILLWQFYCLTH